MMYIKLTDISKFTGTKNITNDQPLSKFWPTGWRTKRVEGFGISTIWTMLCYNYIQQPSLNP